MNSTQELQKLELNETYDTEIAAWLVSIPDSVADNLLVEKVTQDMRRKLHQKRTEGRGGWHTPKCSNNILLDMAQEHITRNDILDAINLLAMVYCRNFLYKEVYFAEK